MTDIVERLRSLLKLDCGPNGPDGRYAARLCMDAMAEAAAEIERLRAALAWQPIETAPRDGRILVWSAVTGPYVTQHIDGEWPWGRFGQWYPRPTHWRPLPDAPA